MPIVRSFLLLLRCGLQKQKQKQRQAQAREIDMMHTKYQSLVHTLSTLCSIFNALEGLNTIVFVAED